MAKSSLPVAKAGNTINDSDKMYEERERKYRAKDAADTLARAAEIKKDKALMRDVKQHVKQITKACS
jgi:hypothetical protein